MKTTLSSFGFVVIVWLVSGTATQGATRIWDGGGANNSWTTATNWVGDVAPVPGDDLVFATGASKLSSENDFPAGTIFNSITFLGANYSLNGASVTLNAGVTLSAVVANNTIFLPLTLASNQTFTVSNASFSAALFLRGPINLAANTLTFAGAGVFQVQSLITGTGGLRKLGAGSALLYVTNTYAGTTDILEGGMTMYRPRALGTTNGATLVAANTSLALGSAGAVNVVEEPLTLAGTLGGVSAAYRWVGPVTLIASNAVFNVNLVTAPLTIDGLVSGSGGFDKTGPGTLTLNAHNSYTDQTRVNDGTLLVNGTQPQSNILLTGGTLGGTGVVGTVTASTVSAKTLAPGASPGILTCSNLTLSASTTVSIELNGNNPGTGYDQLKVTGGVTLSNATLNAALGFLSVISNAFTIIDNDGTDAVTNTFNGLPEGATATISGTPFRVSYTGGSGNDVVLTQLAPTPRPPLGILRSPPTNVVIFWATNFPGYTLEANTNLNTTVWTAVAPAPGVSGTNNVVTNSTSGVQKTYRLRAP